MWICFTQTKVEIMCRTTISSFVVISSILLLCQTSCSPETEYQALLHTTEDKFGLESIRSLHKQLDDDKDGYIEPSETGDFIRADLVRK